MLKKDKKRKLKKFKIREINAEIARIRKDSKITEVAVTLSCFLCDASSANELLLMHY